VAINIFRDSYKGVGHASTLLESILHKIIIIIIFKPYASDPDPNPKPIDKLSSAGIGQVLQNKVVSDLLRWCEIKQVVVFNIIY